MPLCSVSLYPPLFFNSVHPLSINHAVPFDVFVPLCPQLSITVSPLSVSTSLLTVSSFSVTLFTARFYKLSSVYLTLYRLLFLCHDVHCCLLLSVHPLSTSHCTVCCFCVMMSTAVSYFLFTHCLPHTVPFAVSVS